MAIRCRLLSSWRTLLFLAAATLVLGSPWTVGAEEENIAATEALVADAGAGEASSVNPDGVSSYLLAEAQPSAAAEDSEAEQDPWEGFNEPMFRFNRQLDRYIVKPIATGWDFVLPDVVQRSLHNAFDNIRVVPRFVNNVLQLKWHGAGREFARFTLNSSIGLAGFIDVAKDGFGIQQSDEDFGQTLGVWGAKTGPYLVLPLVPAPMTIRDGIGKGVDTLIDPLTWVLPFGASAGIFVTDGINERSLNLDRFQRVEESVVDLYSAVRNAYLQRRAAAIRE
ncbi:MAG TPA: VacJ family lipoprotein [Candidatus Binatia bacterium]